MWPRGLQLNEKEEHRFFQQIREGINRFGKKNLESQRRKSPKRSLNTGTSLSEKQRLEPR